jgi:hypothetical protein
MKIANIFGLHLGCVIIAKDQIKYVGKNNDNPHKLIRVNLRYAYIDIGDYREFRFEFDDCKLLLKPLSAVSEDDKKEFLKFYPHEKRISHFGIDGEDVFVVFIDSTDNLNYVDLATSSSLWLASKGYDIGLVPDEYKEVIE